MNLYNEKFIAVIGAIILFFGSIFIASAALETYFEPQETLLSKFDRTQEVQLFTSWLKTGLANDPTTIKLEFLFTTEDVFAVANRVDIEARALLKGPIEADKIILFLTDMNINYTAINSENIDMVLESAKENDSVLELVQFERKNDDVFFYTKGFITYPIEQKVSFYPIFIGKNGEFGPFEIVEDVLSIHPAYTKIQAEASLATTVSNEIQDRTNQIMIGLTLVIISGIPFNVASQFYLKKKKAS